MPGTVVFFVGPPSNPFIEYFHEPADVVESGTPGVDQGVERFLFERFKRFIVTEFLRDFGTAINPVPALDDRVAGGGKAGFPVNV